jgi:hypothetical protein
VTALVALSRGDRASPSTAGSVADVVATIGGSSTGAADPPADGSTDGSEDGGTPAASHTLAEGVDPSATITSTVSSENTSDGRTGSRLQAAPLQPVLGPAPLGPSPTPPAGGYSFSEPRHLVAEIPGGGCRCELKRPEIGDGVQRLRLRWLWEGDLGPDRRFAVVRHRATAADAGAESPVTSLTDGRECRDWSPSESEWCWERDYHENCARSASWTFTVQVVQSAGASAASPRSAPAYVELNGCVIVGKDP